MSKTLFFSLLIGSGLLLSACSPKAATTVQVDSTAMPEPTSSPEAMMDSPVMTPAPKGTPVDISVDTQLKGTAALHSTNEKKDLNNDLQNTTIVNESFN